MSVRGRTTIAATLVVGLALTLGAWALVATLRHELIDNQDTLAQSRISELAAQATDGRLTGLIAEVGDDGVAQAVSATGQVLAWSSGLTGAGPISAVTPTPDELQTLTLSGVPDDSETENYRIWATSIETDTGLVRIYVGSSLESVSEAVASVRRSLWIGLPALLFLVAATTWALTGRALRPVEDIRAEVAAIGEDDLARRVPLPRSRDEVARLAETMNAMLDRLEVAALRQRDFVADASHELQSPLASLRTQLEVALAQPDSTDWSLVGVHLLAEGDRMERLARDLLFLARQESNLERSGTWVDLDVVVMEEVSRLPVTSVAVTTSGVSAAPLQGDVEDLRRLVRNLLENAHRHARTRVDVATALDNGDVVLTVSDDGPGIEPALREAVFDRFRRLDEARVGDRGAGLGLSIARAIAEQHQGTVTVEDAVGDTTGARLVVRLPSASWPASARPTTPRR